MPPAIRILLIEDNRIEAFQMKSALRLAIDGTFEFKFESVDRLQLGAEILARGGIDLVLLDLHLPDSAGLDSLVRLREQFPAIPIIVFTGQYDDQLGLAAVEKGAVGCLVKQQTDLLALKGAMNRALGRRAEHETQAGAPVPSPEGAKMIFHGVIRGNTIELDATPSLPDGQDVTIEILSSCPGDEFIFESETEPTRSAI